MIWTKSNSAAGATGGSGTNAQLIFSTAVAVGNLMLMGVRWTGSDLSCTFSDNRGNAWFEATPTHQTTGTAFVTLGYSVCSVVANAPTVTCTFGGTVTARTTCGAAFSRPRSDAAVLGTVLGGVVTSDSPSVGPITPDLDDALIMGIIASSSGRGQPGPSGLFTEAHFLGSVQIQFLSQGLHDAISSDWTPTILGATHAMNIVAFRPPIRAFAYTE